MDSESSHRLAEKSRWTAMSDNSISFLRYRSTRQPMAVCRARKHIHLTLSGPLALKLSHSLRLCVDLPLRSKPSKTKNRPRPGLDFQTGRSFKGKRRASMPLAMSSKSLGENTVCVDALRAPRIACRSLGDCPAGTERTTPAI